MRSFLVLLLCLVAPAISTAVEFNGLELGAPYQVDGIRRALGVDVLKCEHANYIISTECEAQVQVEDLRAEVLVGLDDDGTIAQVSFTVPRSDFVRFEQICLARLGTPSKRSKLHIGSAKEASSLDDWLFADGSRAALLEDSASARGATQLILLSKQHRDRTGL